MTLTRGQGHRVSYAENIKIHIFEKVLSQSGLNFVHALCTINTNTYINIIDVISDKGEIISVVFHSFLKNITIPIFQKLLYQAETLDIYCGMNTV